MPVSVVCDRPRYPSWLLASFVLGVATAIMLGSVATLAVALRSASAPAAYTARDRNAMRATHAQFKAFVARGDALTEKWRQEGDPRTNDARQDRLLEIENLRLINDEMAVLNRESLRQYGVRCHELPKLYGDGR